MYISAPHNAGSHASCIMIHFHDKECFEVNTRCLFGLNLISKILFVFLNRANMENDCHFLSRSRPLQL